MHEIKVVERRFDSPTDAERVLAELYGQGWRLVHVTNFVGSNWYFLEREKPKA
jgi:hypothetical protein